MVFLFWNTVRFEKLNASVRWTLAQPRSRRG
jgi:hypothetical protein